MSRVFANGPGNWGSMPGQVIPKTQKMVLYGTLLNTWHYKVRIKGSRAIQGMKEHPPLRFDVVAFEKGPFRSPTTRVTNFTLIYGFLKALYCNYV